MLRMVGGTARSLCSGGAFIRLGASSFPVKHPTNTTAGIVVSTLTKEHFMNTRFSRSKWMQHLDSARKAAFVGLFALTPLAGNAQTNTPQPAPLRNIVLVHGAWADGSSWDKIIPLLEEKGFHVTAVHLPFTTLADDVAAVKRTLDLQDGPVLLVGHSYGGAVITEAGNDPKVAALVYVAAFAPDAGQSAGDQNNEFPAPPGDKEFRPDANGFLKVTDEGIAEDFAQDLPAVRDEEYWPRSRARSADRMNWVQR